MFIAAVILALFALRNLARANNALTITQLIFLVLAGVFSSLDHYFWSTAIESTSVANAQLLNHVSPVWVAFFYIIFLRTRFAPRFWIGLIVTLAGAWVVMGTNLLIRPSFASGDLLALFSSMFYAGFYLALEKGRDKMSALPALWIMTLVTAMMLLIFTQISVMPLAGYSQAT